MKKQNHCKRIGFLPYIIELDFEEELCTDKTEHLYIEKEFKGK